MDEEKRVNSAWIKGPSEIKIKISQPTEGRKSRNNDMQRMPALQHVKGRRRGKQPCHAMQMSLRVGRQSTSASRTAFSPYFCLYFRLYFRHILFEIRFRFIIKSKRKRFPLVQKIKSIQSIVKSRKILFQKFYVSSYLSCNFRYQEF